MHILRFSLLLGALMLAGFERRAEAQEKPKRPPIWSRLTKATVVVIGEVEAIEDKTVEDVAARGAKEKHTYRVAKVKVTDVLVGAKDLKEAKVGFFTEGELKPEQEACFILTKHYAQPFYICSDPQYDLFTRESINYNVWTNVLRESGRCLESAKEMLKSQEPRERLLTASILLSRYRDASVGTRTEPIDAEESKLLLRVLRDADWGREDKPFRLQPQPIFAMLGLTEKDGWNPPKDAAAARLAAENWLIDNHNKYRIQRFVAEAAGK
jgi:hypothetical protein